MEKIGLLSAVIRTTMTVLRLKKSTDGEWRLHMNSASYAKAEKSIEDTGMYEIPVKYQQGEEQEKQLKRI